MIIFHSTTEQQVKILRSAAMTQHSAGQCFCTQKAHISQIRLACGKSGKIMFLRTYGRALRSYCKTQSQSTLRHRHPTPSERSELGVGCLYNINPFVISVKTRGKVGKIKFLVLEGRTIYTKAGGFGQWYMWACEPIYMCAFGGDAAGCEVEGQLSKCKLFAKSYLRWSEITASIVEK